MKKAIPLKDYFVFIFIRPTIVSLFLLVLCSHAICQLSPISLTAASFNNDLIAESGTNPQAKTSIAFDGGANNIFYSNAFKVANPIITAGGLPDSRTIVNGADSWQLAPYTANNCLFFAAQIVVSTKSLFLTLPAKFQQISLLAACGNGNISVTITLHFSDNSTSGYGLFTINDWFAGVPFVTNGLGRILRNAATSAQSGTPTDPRLYQINIVLIAADQLKNVDRIDIKDNSINNSTTVGFFAASAKLSLIPLDISSFHADYQALKQNVLLTWEAENTLNTKDFAVQRSKNGIDFADISQITPEKQSTRSKYTYSDFLINRDQTVFYRIKETLLSGTIEYTNIVTLKTSGSSTIKIIQSFGKIYVLNNDGQTQIQYKLLDISGNVLKKETLASAYSFSIDLQSLPKGVYILYILNVNQNKVFRFIK